MSKEEIIVAVVLGDGHLRIQKNGKNASLELEHCEKQKEFLFYKKNIIEKNIDIKGKIYVCKKRKSIKVTFGVNELFTKVYNNMYVQKTKTIVNIMDLFSDFTLAMFFLDDGTAKIKTCKTSEKKVYYNVN